VTGAVEGIVLAAAITVAVLVAAAACLLAWWLLRGKPRGEARAEAARLERQQARDLEDARRAAVRHQRALEIEGARAANIGLAVVAALSQHQMQSPQWAAQPVPVYRAEVQK